MSDAITTAITNIGAQLDQNATINGRILKDETDRLKLKQADIANAKFGQQRIIDLNRSQMKRTAAYTKVGVVTVVSLGMIFILRMFGSFIPVPEVVLGIIYVLLVSLCVFYGLYVYADVNGRESTNFDRYNIPPPVIAISEADKAKAQAKVVAAGNLIAANAGNQLCSGQACCDLYSVYNSSTNKCNACALNDTTAGSGYYDNTTNACATCVLNAASSTGSGRYNSETKSCNGCATSGQTWKVGTGTDAAVYACRT